MPGPAEAKGVITSLFSIGKLIAMAFNASWSSAFLLLPDELRLTSLTLALRSFVPSLPVSKESMMRKWFRWATLVVFASLSLTSVALAAKAKANQSSKAAAASGQSSKAVAAKPKAIPAAKPHRIVIHVDQNDAAVMNLALNNATNVIDYYRAKHVEVKVDLVTYGPGLHMLRDDTSPVKDRIKQLKDYAFPSTVQFSACGNTKENMEKKEGHPITVLSEAVIVPSGVVHLMELQEKGWSYLRP